MDKQQISLTLCQGILTFSSCEPIHEDILKYLSELEGSDSRVKLLGFVNRPNTLDVILVDYPREIENLSAPLDYSPSFELSEQIALAVETFGYRVERFHHSEVFRSELHTRSFTIPSSI